MQPIPHYAFCALRGHHAKRYILSLVRFQRQREILPEPWGSIDTFRTQQALSYGFGCSSTDRRTPGLPAGNCRVNDNGRPSALVRSRTHPLGPTSWTPGGSRQTPRAWSGESLRSSGKDRSWLIFFLRDPVPALHELYTAEIALNLTCVKP